LIIADGEIADGANGVCVNFLKSDGVVRREHILRSPGQSGASYSTAIG
jgi:hypothetical protein